jgi:hypothetical protein
LSEELLDWIESNPSFRKSLKLNNPNRFIKLPFLITSHTPRAHKLHKDEIIGIWYLDKNNYQNNQEPLFKQDFIVNKLKQNKEFVSFAANSFANGDYVEPIDNFFKIYGSGGKYYHKSGIRWEHHYDSVADLPGNRLQMLALSELTKLKNS